MTGLKTWSRWTAVATATVLGTSGCFYPAERARLLEARVEELSREQATLVSQIEEARQGVAQTLPQVDRKLAEVAQALQQLDASSRRSGADIGVQMGKLLEDVAMLTGQLDAQRHQLAELEARLDESTRTTESSLAALKSPEALAAAAERTRLEEQRRLAESAPPDELLAKAEEALAARSFGDARTLFAGFVSRYPKNPLLPRGLLGLGQSYQGQEKCREALYEYQKVVQNHGKSEQAPKALIGSSDCFGALKMAPESRLALETVVQEYPRSPEAPIAKERLAALDRAAKPAAPKAAPKATKSKPRR